MSFGKWKESCLDKLFTEYRNVFMAFLISKLLFSYFDLNIEWKKFDIFKVFVGVFTKILSGRIMYWAWFVPASQHNSDWKIIVFWLYQSYLFMKDDFSGQLVCFSNKLAYMMVVLM